MENLVEKLRALYPKRDGAQGWSAVQRLLNAYTVETEAETIIAGTKQYAIHCGRKAMTGTEYVLKAQTFYGRDRHWLEWSEMDLRSPSQIAADSQWATLETRATALGFTTVDRSRGMDVARRAIEQAEAAASRDVVARAGLNLRVVR